MARLKKILSDWWRGYSDEDVISAAIKMSNSTPGEAIPVTGGEMKAIIKERMSYPQRVVGYQWVKQIESHP